MESGEDEAPGDACSAPSGSALSQASFFVRALSLQLSQPASFLYKVTV